MAKQTVIDLMLNASMVSDRLKKQMTDMTDLWAGLMTKANKSVFTVKQIRGLDKVRKEYEKAMESAILQVDAAEKRLKKNRKDQEAKDIIASGKERIKQLKAETQARVLAESTIIDKRQALADKYAKNFGEELDRNIFSVQKAEEFGDSIGEAFADVSSMELKNWSGLVKKLGQFSGRQGARADVAAVGKEGAEGKNLAGLGKVLGGIGKALMVAAGAFAVIAAVAKVIMDADAATKELNRSLFDAGVAGADLADSYGMVSDAIDNTRISFSKAIRFNIEWGTTAKDNLEILGKYAEAGLTFKEITKGTQDAAEQMGYLQKATEHALIYSKLLGKSAEEVAQDSATAMEDFGLTLKGVAEQFSIIIGYAKESGFATKRFYGMIQQATSGMSMYNIRLSEASELLIQLGKTLGQDLAQDYLGGLAKGFKDESTQDRVRKSMTTGVKTSLDILRDGAIKAATDFQHALMNFGKEQPEQAKKFWDTLSRGIGKEARGLSGEDLAKELQKMPSKQRAQLLAEAETINPALARQLSGVTGKSQAFGKGLGAAQAAREYAGPAETLLLNLNELQRVLGKRVDQIDMTNIRERMAWENITGIQGEAARRLYEIGQRYNGINESLKKAKAGGPEAIKAWNKEFAEKFGVWMDRTGKRFSYKKDAEGTFQVGGQMEDTVNALVMNMGDAINEAIGTTLTQDQQTAQEIADNTRDMSHFMEVGMTALLESIDESVRWIVNKFSGGAFEAKRAAGDILNDRLGAARKKTEGLRDEKKALYEQLKTGTFNAEEKDVLKKRIEALDDEIKTSEENQERIREQSRVVRNAKGKTVEEVLASSAALSARSAFDRLPAAQQAEVEARAKAKYDAYMIKREESRSTGVSVAGASGIGGRAVGASQAGKSTLPEKTMEEFLSEEIGINDTQQQFMKQEKQGNVALVKAIGELSEEQKEVARQNVRQSLLSSNLFSPEEVKKLAPILERGGTVEGMGLSPWQIEMLEAQGLIGGSRPTHDMVMQMGNGRVKFAQRVDNADTVSVSKPGGALSKIGGGVTNIFHLYNDGHGVMRTIEKAQKAGLMRG